MVSIYKVSIKNIDYPHRLDSEYYFFREGNALDKVQELKDCSVGRWKKISDTFWECNQQGGCLAITLNVIYVKL